MTQRREFIRHIAIGGAALATLKVHAAGPLVADNDPQATPLGYKTDASQVDKAKYPKFAAGQNCSNCTLFQGKPGDASGGCPLFAGKQVSSKAWCSAYTKKV